MDGLEGDEDLVAERGRAPLADLQLELAQDRGQGEDDLRQGQLVPATSSLSHVDSEGSKGQPEALVLTLPKGHPSFPGDVVLSNPAPQLSLLDFESECLEEALGLEGVGPRPDVREALHGGDEDGEGRPAWVPRPRPLHLRHARPRELGTTQRVHHGTNPRLRKPEPWVRWGRVEGSRRPRLS